jgi:inner membrane protein
MFNSTHTFVGLAIARTGVDKWVRHATITAVLASNLPDIDSIAGFWGTPAYLDHHRGITHSLVGVPLLALLLSVIMYFFSGNFGRTYAVAFIAMATHPALDYLNPYGVRPFLPFNSTWYYGDLVFIIDPYLDVLLLVALLASWRWHEWRRFMVYAGLALGAGYVGLRLQLHNRVASSVRALASQVESDVRPEKWAVMPDMLDPRLWEVIVASGDSVAKFDACALRCDRNETEMTPMVSSPLSDISTRAAKTRSAAAFLRFARFPVTHVQQIPAGYRVTFFDFRFYREGARTALGAEILLDSSLNVTSERLSFVQPIQ